MRVKITDWAIFGEKQRKYTRERAGQVVDIIEEKMFHVEHILAQPLLYIKIKKGGMKNERNKHTKH